MSNAKHESGPAVEQSIYDALLNWLQRNTEPQRSQSGSALRNRR